MRLFRSCASWMLGATLLLAAAQSSGLSTFIGAKTIGAKTNEGFAVKVYSAKEKDGRLTP